MSYDNWKYWCKATKFEPTSLQEMFAKQVLERTCFSIFHGPGKTTILAKLEEFLHAYRDGITEMINNPERTVK